MAVNPKNECVLVNCQHYADLCMDIAIDETNHLRRKTVRFPINDGTTSRPYQFRKAKHDF
jgi:hypothetical protein